MPKAAALAAGTNSSGARKAATPTATALVITPAAPSATKAGLRCSV